MDPWVGKTPWRRAWQPTPAFLPGESHGQRSLEDYSPWDHKELDMTERLSTRKKLQIAKTISKKNKAGRPALPDFKFSTKLQ